ncbi:hypothetical protein [Mycobacteroides abscessus]|uniref:hypothetical protein n=1 Tax=Mycobacteroides abscessus TaxID=36809 RepID=UPI0009287B6E|nr:hypothetical protein [Mycobacteroides abscessus]MDO3327523.1 hypothetical protein [Mycobacteroides abscessus subsp. abscessus]SHT36122.1 Uncharacterised protein [Mycobacteroides abscessus subsp. abscessus]SHU45403.1 Uncharacterised protein [Mycobacteroides abscessus subsp. abscessus]SIK02552.1 Uncharacterised protein [Mycobacteroides abscessus subsp. abscessus]
MQHRSSVRHTRLLIAAGVGAIAAAFLLSSPEISAQPDGSLDAAIARLTDQGYRVTVETFGDCDPHDGTIVATRIGPTVWADTTSDTKAGGGGTDAASTGQAGSRGGVPWTRSVSYRIAYVTVNCQPGSAVR